ncbi:MAG: hypothetical protein KJ072_24230 [Verrucomicrobia bacterium]|nr:hypothetical protein [Verrucomicrobiota bacterium]
MSNWPAGTRNRILYVLLVGSGLVLLIWFGLVSPLQARLKVRTAKAELARMQLQLAHASLDKAPHYRALADEKRAEIAELESLMAEGGLLLWQYGILMPYAKPYDVNFQTWETLALGEIDVPPKVPYRMATFAVTGEAHYHAFGKFLADFENSSPFIKVKGLTLQSVSPGFRSGGDAEQLRFRLEYHILSLTNAMVATR